MTDHGEDDPPQDETVRTAAEPRRPFWRDWWRVPLGLGIVISVLGDMALYLGVRAGGFNIWYLAAIGPYILGLALIVAAVRSRNSTWLQFDIEQPDGRFPRTIHFGIPLPLGVGSWLLRQVSTRGGGASAATAAKILDELANYPENGQPLAIHVDGNNGEQVEIRIVR